VPIAVGCRIHRGEEVLEAEEVEEGERAVRVTVRVAPPRAAPAGDVLDGDAAAAGEVELARRVERGASSVVEGCHGLDAPGDAEVERVPLAAVPLGDAPGVLTAGLREGAADIERRAGSVIEDVHGADIPDDAAADRCPPRAVPAGETL